MSNLPLQELMAQLEKELSCLRYREQTIRYYRMMWKRIATFFENKSIDHFTEEVGMRFLGEQYDFFELEKAGKLAQSIMASTPQAKALGFPYWKNQGLFSLLEMCHSLRCAS